MTDESPPEPVVKVTMGEIYALLQRLDRKVNDLVSTGSAMGHDVADHEARIREIEARENLVKRVDILAAKVESLERRVWAIPSAAVLLAAAAVVVTLIRTF